MEEFDRMRIRSMVISAGTLVFLTGGSGLCTVASATPSTLHLNATVYDTHQGKGVFSSKEKVFQGTSQVGEDSSRCTERSKTMVHCIGSYTLTHGTIQFSGSISSSSNTNRLTITGGTGTYRGARGTVLTEYNRTGTKAKETLTFK
jgi:hypothetical protein